MFWNDGCRSLSKNNFDDLPTCQWKCEGTHPKPQSISHIESSANKIEVLNKRFITFRYSSHLWAYYLSDLTAKDAKDVESPTSLRA
uniref:BPTI/Kunitz inhibitor domain-containing protein n=1 Tax=Parascaris equorum TaxID=6256 RepID=A0A914S1N5_PAREQ